LVQKLLKSYHADPSAEVHPSLKLAKEMEDSELSELLSDSGASQAQAKPRPVPVEKPPSKPHKENMCYVCERNKATQKLILCMHVVSCRGCIKNLIEEHVPCPVCNLSFYATATIPDVSS
jgi:hypothetical protein